MAIYIHYVSSIIVVMEFQIRRIANNGIIFCIPITCKVIFIPKIHPIGTCCNCTCKNTSINLIGIDRQSRILSKDTRKYSQAVCRFENTSFLLAL